MQLWKYQDLAAIKSIFFTTSALYAVSIPEQDWLTFSDLFSGNLK